LDHTILAVDDEPSNLRMLVRLLHRHFKLLTATNGEEALQIINRENVSLIITDQRMPGMLGTELLRHCRKINPLMISMMVTANNDIDTFMEAIRQSGASRVINKPWDPDDLLTAVHDALAKYEKGIATHNAMNRLKQVSESLKQMRKA
jgi:DNA-binding NtrC family response regulator